MNKKIVDIYGLNFNVDSSKIKINQYYPCFEKFDQDRKSEWKGVVNDECNTLLSLNVARLKLARPPSRPWKVTRTIG